MHGGKLHVLAFLVMGWEQEEKFRGRLASVAKARSLNARKKLKASQSSRERAPSKNVVDIRWMLARKMLDGGNDVKAR